MKQKPNILFLLPDEHRGDWIPQNKKLPLKMPNLENLSKRGVTFKNAITPSPLCAPARACLAAGCDYKSCEVADNGFDYPINKPTFYSKLKELGYSVGGVGKFDLHKASYTWGLSGWIDDLGKMGFTTAIDNAGKIDAVVSAKDKPMDPYMLELEKKGYRQYHIDDMLERNLKTHPTELPDELYCDNWITSNALDMLSKFEADKPWFLQVNFTGPHPPFDVTKKMKERWENIKFDEPIESNLDKETVKKCRQNYAAMLENIDKRIGDMIEFLKKTNQLQNTIIVYSSDHGEMLGDYSFFGKCRPENPSVSIPLVIAGPNIKENVVSDELVILQDLAATFCDYAGMKENQFKDSLSLKDFLSGKTQSVRDYQYSSLYPENIAPYFHKGETGWNAYLTKDYKMVVWDKTTKKYYKRFDDSKELLGKEREKAVEVFEYLTGGYHEK